MHRREQTIHASRDLRNSRSRELHETCPAAGPVPDGFNLLRHKSSNGLPIPPAGATVFNQVEQMSGWNSCNTPSCAGGSGNGTYWMAQNQTSLRFPAPAPRSTTPACGTTPCGGRSWARTAPPPTCCGTSTSRSTATPRKARRRWNMTPSSLSADTTTWSAASATSPPACGMSGTN